MIRTLLSCGVGKAISTTLRTDMHFLDANLTWSLNKPFVNHSKVFFINKQIVISAFLL